MPVILIRLIAVWLLSLYAAMAPAKTAQDPALAGYCYRAIDQVAQESGVPRAVLLAITLTETGRKMAGDIRPWPWTVNMEGKGVWFDTPAEAQAYVNRHFQRGARSFDVGCFQINYKWHHQHFNSIQEMFDPLINTRYAARFLKSLYVELGDWTRAAGAYHSRTPKFANRYAKRFARYVARIEGRGDAVYLGNGSEDFRLAEGSGLPTSQPPPTALLTLGQTLPPGNSTGGSLFDTGTGGGGLLRAARGALY